MTAVSLLLLALLAAASGVAVMGTVATPLRLEERVVIAVVAAFALDSIVCYLLSLAAGLGTFSVLVAPLVVVALGLGAARLLGVDPLAVWADSWRQARGAVRTVVGVAGVTLFFGLCLSLLFSRAMFVDPAGGLVTGYWIPDWAGHLITASSFSVSQNLSLQDPLMSGTPLYYPFLPDFSAAMLMRLGLGQGPSLWVPQVVLGVCMAVLVVSFAARLRVRRAAGVIAVGICLLGGGLGFLGALHDACTSSGTPAAQCSAGYVISHPGAGAAITAGTLRALPGVVADPPRGYDGMTTAPGGSQVFADQQWYTPLFAWWLPQRTLLEGFDTVVAVLILMLAALERTPAIRWDVALAGALAGLLLVIHVQSLFALVIIGAGLALLRWRPAWIGAAAACLVVAGPRLVLLLGAPHGSAEAGNQYPWFDPGWMSGTFAAPATPATLSAANLALGAGEVLRLPFSGTFWSFWVMNLGVALPLCVLLAAAAVLRRAVRDTASRAGRVAGRACAAVLAGLPGPLLRFLLAGMLVFVLANMVVFQSWDWDNTKLLVYWYLAVALCAGAVAQRLWAGIWRRLLAVVLVASMVATGVLVVARLIPHAPPCTPAQAAQGVCPAAVSPLLGPFTLASAADRTLAGEVEAGTATDAVFLVPDTGSSYADPVSLLTGRPTVMGWTGWLWSYGLDYVSRQRDVDTAYAGCGASAIARCPTILGILRKYDVSYVEVTPAVAAAGLIWWTAQGLPVVARGGGTVVYDVRGAAGT
jgi:hypothetical protein